MTDLLAGRADMRAVTYQYPTAADPVLRDITISIEEGSFVLITGVSGSGKSTLLRALNGLVPHFSGGRFGGTVEIAGLNTRRTPTRALSRHAGFVFQDSDAQTISGSVIDEVAFGLEQLGVPMAIMRRQVEEALELTGIGHLRSRDVGTLSGGERQRVAIAASLAMGPRMLILDEPTSQLDPAGADDVFQTLHRLNDEMGMTVVVSEHRLERVAQHADRLHLLRSGQPSIEGSPRAVLSGEGAFLATGLMRAGRMLGWKPLPLSVREGRNAFRESVLHVPASAPVDRLPARPVVVELRGVDLNHGGLKVLESVSLDFRAGEVVALIGSNGSGKTTLLRAIAGLHPARRGAVALHGQPVSNVPRSEIGKKIGFLPQQARTLLFNATVREEIAFSLKHRHVNVSALDALLEEFDLMEMAADHPFDLSSGEQERLALAATVAGDPSLLLLDEPTRGLDAPRKAALAGVLQRRAREGTSVVLATHDVELAAAVADRVVLLGGGRIIAEGSPRDVLGNSLVYGTQINKVFGGGLLTVDDVRKLIERNGIDDNMVTLE